MALLKHFGKIYINKIKTMDTVKEQLLKDFKKANQQAKVKLALKYGFSEPSEYLAYLTEKQPVKLKTVGGGKKYRPKKVVVKPTVHLVHILDASSSMNSGNKIGKANEAIQSAVQAARVEDKVDYIYNLISFSSTGDIKTHVNNTKINEVGIIPNIKARSMTALYEAVGVTLLNLLGRKKTEEKVLVEIFTDGEENDSHGEYRTPGTLKELIKKCEGQGFTVTFIGTDKDVMDVVNNLKIDLSNTMKYDGTADGLLASMTFATTSRSAYAEKLSKGQDVSLNYFSKQTGKL